MARIADELREAFAPAEIAGDLVEPCFEARRQIVGISVEADHVVFLLETAKPAAGSGLSIRPSGSRGLRLRRRIDP